MLDFINQSEAVPMREREAEFSRYETTYNRDQKEDTKLAVEYIFELHEKLVKLHPQAFAIAQRMLKIKY